MGISRCPLILNNVLCGKVRCKADEWYDAAMLFRSMILENGIYVTGPVIHQASNLNVRSNEADYTLYYPISAPLRLKRNDKYNFQQVFRLNDGLLLRHGDLEEDINISYDALRVYAKANKLKLKEPFYNIYLDIYAGAVMDIYAPISRW